MFGYFSDSNFAATGGMLFKLSSGKESVITTDSDVQDEKLGRFVGETVEFVGYRPSPKWVKYDPSTREFTVKKD